MTVAADELARERRRWALPGSRWDRYVKFAKRGLPLGATAVLLTCLIWPMTASREFSFLLSKDSVEMADERMRIERPAYRGEDSQGRGFSILAERAVQRTSNSPIVELTDIEARLVMAEGVATVSALLGRYDMEKERLRVTGPVKFRRPDGYTLETADVTVDLPARKVVSAGRVKGRVPLGSFAADRLDVDLEGRTLKLSGNTKMRISQR